MHELSQGGVGYVLDWKLSRAWDKTVARLRLRFCRVRCTVPRESTVEACGRCCIVGADECGRERSLPGLQDPRTNALETETSSHTRSGSGGLAYHLLAEAERSGSRCDCDKGERQR